MKTRIALTALALCGVPSVDAEATTDVVTPVALTGERVEVLVGGGLSFVEASLDYIYVRRWDNETVNAPILVDVPVFTSEEDATFASLAESTDIRLKRGEDEYRPMSGEFVHHTDWTPIPLVPEGSRIFVFRFSLPRSAVKLRFTVNVRYVQAHVGPPGQEAFAFIPFLPVSERLKDDLELKPENYQLAFSATSDVRLRLLSVNPEKVSVTPERIELLARDRETVVIATDRAASAPPSQ